MKEKIAIFSILANIVLAAGKITVGFFSGSAAVLAEGIHSFMDVFSSAISYVGIRYSKKPGDDEHPYGHYKFEVLSGAVITIILFATGAGIVWDAWQSFLDPGKIEIGYLAFLAMMASAIVNEAMARVKIYYGKKENSISLLSDGIHSRVDVYSSLAVFAGLFLTRFWAYTDSVLAGMVGLYIIKESLSLGKEAVDSLLDISAGLEVEEEIRSIASKQKVEIEHLKTQKKWSAITANIKIKLPSSLKVSEAEKISDGLRKKLMEKIENLQYVAIQIASHKIESNFFQPEFGRGFGWQRRGKSKTKEENTSGEGPGGYCVCEKCGHKTSHEKGVPCSSLDCPACGGKMKRGK
ncbi:MAG: cation diffusion facilitator family transporter [Candidatus Moranbacteria bacterium]|nr:cation diffusion facilitator family transporter [Candidatus Moranbacteria bacterium]